MPICGLFLLSLNAFVALPPPVERECLSVPPLICEQGLASKSCVLGWGRGPKDSRGSAHWPGVGQDCVGETPLGTGVSEGSLGGPCPAGRSSGTQAAVLV